jgi:hypothetical protein
MADHGGGVFTGPQTPEELLADRRRMWGGFTMATTITVVFCALTLILMGIFLV